MSTIIKSGLSLCDSAGEAFALYDTVSSLGDAVYSTAGGVLEGPLQGNQVAVTSIEGVADLSDYVSQGNIFYLLLSDDTEVKITDVTSFKSGVYWLIIEQAAEQYDLTFGTEFQFPTGESAPTIGHGQRAVLQLLISDVPVIPICLASAMVYGTTTTTTTTTTTPAPP